MILVIQMHRGGCAVVGSQMAELTFYQHDSEMTCKSSQFEKKCYFLLVIYYH